MIHKPTTEDFPCALDAEHYVMEVRLRRERVPSFDQYPYSLPALRDFERLALHPAVTFLVGENGSGKSTLLEAIATACGFNPEGGSKNFRFATFASHSPLYEQLLLVKTHRRPRDGFFLRAESFYNVATEVDALGVGDSYGGRSLHAQSHGEAFLSLMTHRFRGEAFYVLDEPEAALSPARQLAMLARLHELVKRRSQFIVATHSPILLSYPDAWIYQIGEHGPERVRYEDTEHYALTRSFLNSPQSFLRNLLD
ncbi:AAA family ATPase [Frateuria defendens]|uniref:AAA family ATPase n=1 Tax=Frateuria defendens TaxID=2219559 RepID=UPI00066FE272|nr:AAA family ATPase [Frateuria defendens]